jgi:hypothetical protein
MHIKTIKCNHRNNPKITFIHGNKVEMALWLVLSNLCDNDKGTGNWPFSAELYRVVNVFWLTKWLHNFIRSTKVKKKKKLALS